MDSKRKILLVLVLFCLAAVLAWRFYFRRLKKKESDPVTSSALPMHSSAFNTSFAMHHPGGNNMGMRHSDMRNPNGNWGQWNKVVPKQQQ